MRIEKFDEFINEKERAWLDKMLWGESGFSKYDKDKECTEKEILSNLIKKLENGEGSITKVGGMSFNIELKDYVYQTRFYFTKNNKSVFNAILRKPISKKSENWNLKDTIGNFDSLEKLRAKVSEVCMRREKNKPKSPVLQPEKPTLAAWEERQSLKPTSLPIITPHAPESKPVESDKPAVPRISKSYKDYKRYPFKRRKKS